MYCVLGAFQVSATGDLANWHTGDPDAIPAVGGAMDLATGARQTLVMMSLLPATGRPKLVPELHLPADCGRLRHPRLHRPGGLRLTGNGCRGARDASAPRRRAPGPAVGPAARSDRTVRQTSTEVAVVGAGPAGLMLSHLLAKQASTRSDRPPHPPGDRGDPPRRHPGARQRQAARRHRRLGPGAEGRRRARGIELRFGGESHRIDFHELVGTSRLALPADRRVPGPRRRARAATEATSASGSPTPPCPTSRPTGRRCGSPTRGGTQHEVRARVLVGADGSRSLCRHQFPADLRRSTSASTPSPGSASCARPRAAHRS